MSERFVARKKLQEDLEAIFVQYLNNYGLYDERNCMDAGLAKIELALMRGRDVLNGKLDSDLKI